MNCVYADLFTSDAPAYGHCISADRKMGAGIAKQFKFRYGAPKDRTEVGRCAAFQNGEGRWIYNLVTKAVYNKFPTYEDLESSLRDMRRHMDANKITEVALPVIGCGLDKLQWPRVKKIIASVLQGVTVHIHTLDQWFEFGDDVVEVSIESAKPKTLQIEVVLFRPTRRRPIVIDMDCTRKLGSHMKWDKTLMTTCKRAYSMGMSCCQLFLAGSPTRFSQRSLPDLKEVGEWSRENDFTIVSHLPYILNMGGKVSGWDDEAMERNSAIVTNQLRYLSEIGGVGVIHPGSRKDRKKGMADAAVAIYNACQPVPDTKLFLEICAGEGTKFPITADECRYMFEAMDSANKVGVCVDTAHVWGSGIYDISASSGISSMYEEFHNLGVDVLWHFNDSAVKCGSCVDNHAPLRRGQIWSDNGDPLAQLFEATMDDTVIIESCENDFIRTLDINGRGC